MIIRVTDWDVPDGDIPKEYFYCQESCAEAADWEEENFDTASQPEIKAWLTEVDVCDFCKQKLLR